MLRGLFVQTFLLLSLAFKGISAIDAAAYAGAIEVDLCGDTPDTNGLSFAFKIAIEDALSGYYSSVHENDGFGVMSLDIDEFVEANDCPDVEDDITRRKLRGTVYSVVYYIFTGQCTGSCPVDPSDEIDGINDRQRGLKVLDDSLESTKKKNKALRMIMSETFPEITHAKFLNTGDRINCNLDHYCYGNGAVCCGVGDCSCMAHLVLCDSQGLNCRDTIYPTCLYDSSCDNSIAISDSKQTLVIGSGYLDVNASVQVYDKQDDGIWQRRGEPIIDPYGSEHVPDSSEKHKRGGQFGSSVSINNSGNRLAIGSYNESRVGSGSVI